ncbi:dipeptidase [bacterium]|nr:dipeptidase [bacterium]
MMDDIIRYLDDNARRYVDELKEFCRFDSVSADPARADRVRACCDWLAERIRKIGFPSVEIIPTKHHPLIVAEWPGPPDAPSVLVYGHYDVQPEDPIDLWETPPFTLTERDGKLFGRGATDDKGQFYTHLAAIEAWAAVRGAPPCTVKLIVEGEEEVGSENIAAWFAENHTRLAADVVLISDTAMFAPGRPSITYGLRGLAYFQLDIQAADRDLHSGSFGGAVDNPVQALANVLASMKDAANGRILIDGIYDDVRELTGEERDLIAALPHDDAAYAAEIGAPALHGETGFSTLERTWARPTFEANGIWGGYQGPGAKTVLPAKAGAKFSLRLVPDQTPEKTAALVRAHLEKVMPAHVRYTLLEIHGGRPFLIPLDDPYLRAAARAVTRGFGAECGFHREGGSIPITVDFAERLNAPVVLLGWGLHTERTHAPNEHFHLENFFGGMKSVAWFYEELMKV